MIPQRVTARLSRSMPDLVQGDHAEECWKVEAVQLVSTAGSARVTQFRAREEVTRRVEAGEPWTAEMAWSLARRLPRETHEVAARPSRHRARAPGPRGHDGLVADPWLNPRG